MTTIFPKKELHKPKWFIIDASDQILGRFVTKIANLLQGKDTSYFFPSIDQGNFVIVINSNKVIVSGEKKKKKLYFRNSQRPGSLKTETFNELQNRLPNKIIETSVKGMLPKTKLGRQYFRRLFVFSTDDLIKNKQLQEFLLMNTEN